MKKTTMMPLMAALVFTLAVSGPARAEVSQGVAPDFALKSNSGDNIRFSELHGKVVMINFWASWCGPCRQEMPLLDAMYQRYKGLGFTILGVNVEEDPKAARKLLESIPVSFPVLFDTQNKVSSAYNVIAMPSTVLVDRDGKMRFLHKGYLPGYELEYEKQIKTLLKE